MQECFRNTFRPHLQINVNDLISPLYTWKHCCLIIPGILQPASIHFLLPALRWALLPSVEVTDDARVLQFSQGLNLPHHLFTGHLPAHTHTRQYIMYTRCVYLHIALEMYTSTVTCWVSGSSWWRNCNRLLCSVLQTQLRSHLFPNIALVRSLSGTCNTRPEKNQSCHPTGKKGKNLLQLSNTGRRGRNLS